MNDQPTPYQHPGRRSRLTVVKGDAAPPLTLSPLVKGMVTGMLGKIPMTSEVYEQIELGDCEEPLAWVRFKHDYEVLGISDGHVIRDLKDHSAAELPQLILSDGAR
ncbi:UNVERIFIED_ORG: hypothetical protein J2X79_000558 [Arthrobacter globiformis]|nr:hypothetical protein [Arthrobacter globiformis]